MLSSRSEVFVRHSLCLFMYFHARIIHFLECGVAMEVLFYFFPKFIFLIHASNPHYTILPDRLKLLHRRWWSMK